jgi:hypothetical protein
MFRFLLVSLVIVIINFQRVVQSQEQLVLPTDEDTRVAVIKASDWLKSHVKTGRLAKGDRELSISMIAWKDPTLAPELLNQLAGYAITDTLWSSYALTLTEPKLARELHDSLSALDCLGNSLHEVIWRPIESIAHKPIDADIVHGRSIGKMLSGNSTIDIRSFTMAADNDFEVGHPLLFAEHAAYQSIYEFRLGKHISATERLRSIFRDTSESSSQRVHWNREHGVLMDFVTEDNFKLLQAGDTTTIRQYSFKLATLHYACRLLGLEPEFPDTLKEISRKLASAQLKSGGVSHFFDVDTEHDMVYAGADATGEATAMFVLTNTIVTR